MTQNYTKFAINDKKQAELDSLSAQITRTEYKVAQLQAIVTSLTAKQSSFETALSTAETSRSSALNNLNMVKEVVASIKEMVRKADTVASQTDTANTQIDMAAENISILIKQLIYSVEVIDKLAQLINKKQASKVLISSELVSAVNTASSDANSAIALTLTALNNCNTAMVSGGEADSAAILEQTQSLHLFGLVTGNTKVIENQINYVVSLQKAKVSQQVAKENLQAALRDLAGVAGDISWDEITPNKDGKDYCQSLLNTAKAEADTANTAFDKAASASSLTAESVEEYNTLKTVNSQALSKWEKLEALLKALDALIAADITLDKAKISAYTAEAALNKIFAEYNAIKPGKGSLYDLLVRAYKHAEDSYTLASDALAMVQRELIQGEANLVSASVDLNSLNAGLAAASAAALAA